MRPESRSAASIRAGGHGVFVLPRGPDRAPEVKFPVVPDRLPDSIIDDALAAGVARLNGFLPEGVSLDITSVDLRQRARNPSRQAHNCPKVALTDKLADRLKLRRLSAALPAGPFLVLWKGGVGLLVPFSYHAGFTR